MSSYQRNYWFPKVAEHQGGEYCAGCGISKDSNWPNKTFTGLRIDKINNDGNHTIGDNTVKDFKLLCISCNRIKNPVQIPKDQETTQSEATNNRAGVGGLEGTILVPESAFSLAVEHTEGINN